MLLFLMKTTIKIAAGEDRIGLIAKGGYVPIEYYKDPKKSAETFITAPDGMRYTIPGDMGRHNEDGTVTMARAWITLH